MMVDELIKYDLSLDVYFTYGPAASVLSRPVLSRREGQPIFMRGRLGSGRWPVAPSGGT